MKVQYFISVLCLFILFACENETKVIDNQKSIKTHQSSDFRGKTFEYGKSYNFFDCQFNFECDCCSADIYFDSDSTFYYYDYCLASNSLLDGNYIVENNKLTLLFSKTSVYEQVELKVNNNSDLTLKNLYTVTTYHYRKMNPPLKIDFFIEECKTKIHLIEDVKSDKSFAIENKIASNMNETLIENKLVQKIDSLRLIEN